MRSSPRLIAASSQSRTTEQWIKCHREGKQSRTDNCKLTKVYIFILSNPNENEPFEDQKSLNEYVPFGPRCEKTCLRWFANNKVTDQSLISAFVICLFESIIYKLMILAKFQFLGKLCSWAGWFGYDHFGNLEDRFSRVEAHFIQIFTVCKIKLILQKYNIWAVTCDFQQCGILTNVDSDKPVQSPFKLRNWMMFGQ